MEEYEEAIAKKELAIDILKEYKTTTAIEWFKDKGVNDFVSLDVSEEYGSLCFKYLNNKYKINSYEDQLSISCNGKTVLRVLLVEKIVDDKTYYEFDWSDDNNIQELRLYDWVEEFPIIVNKEIYLNKSNQFFSNTYYLQNKY